MIILDKIFYFEAAEDNIEILSHIAVVLEKF